MMSDDLARMIGVKKGGWRQRGEEELAVRAKEILGHGWGGR